MAILNLEAVKGAVRHSASVSGGRTYGIELLAEVDDLITGPIAIRNQLAAWGYAPGANYRWPLAGTIAEQDFGSFLQQIDIEPSSEDGLQYRVTLGFSPIDPSREGADSSNPTVTNNWIMSPFSATPTLHWTSEDVEFAITHDRDAKPVVNKAGDPFDPPLITTLTIPVAVVTRIEKSFNPAYITLFKSRVNSAVWQGWTAESVLIKDITGERTHDPDHGTLWRTSYSFAFNPSTIASTPGGDKMVYPGWSTRVLNAGLRQLVGGILEPILAGGAPASTPVPLDNDGKALEPDGEPVYLTFNTRLKADFDGLNLPSDLFSASTP